MDNFKLQLNYDQSAQMTEEDLADFVALKLNNLINAGALSGVLKDILVDYEIPDSEGFILVELIGGCMLDASKLNTEGASMVTPSDLGTPRTFSVASIKERLIMMNKNPKIRLKAMIRDYVKYYNSQEKNLLEDRELLSRFLSLFVLDLMGLFNDVLPEIKSGKQLGTLLGVRSVSTELNEIAGRLSIAYKKALKSEESSGQLNKNVLTILKDTYSEFINELVKELFFKNFDQVTNTTEQEVPLSNIKRVPFNV